MQPSANRLHSLVVTATVLAAVSQPLAAQTFTLFGDPPKVISGDDKFVAPVTAPYYSESSFITSDVRLWYAHHSFNGDSILGSDASANDYAAQLRLALTDRLQFVAYKDGYLDFDGSVVNSEGWNDIGAGLKLQWFRDDEIKLYSALGGGYEFNWGESRALQNDGEARLWASLDKGFGKFHAGVTLNYRLATSDDDRDNGNSDMFTWHLRADYRLTEYLSPVVEFNGYHITNGTDAGLPLNGADVVNFGSGGADATVTAGLGVELRVNDRLAVRGAYELPLTNNDESLFGDRLTFSLIFEF